MKIGNMYNLDSFQAFLKSGEKPGFTDALGGAILARTLTQVDPRVFEKSYPELALVNSGIQASNAGGYARRIQSLRIQKLGSFADAYSRDDNAGEISLAGEENFLKVRERTANSHWSESEIKEAEMQNINLPERFIRAHNDIYMREVDEIGLLGFSNTTGLLNHPGFISSAATGAVDTLTGQQMYDEIASLITDQHDSVQNTVEYSANRVIMPIDVINRLKSTILNSAGSTKNVLQSLRDNFPGVEFFGSFRASSVDGSSRTVAFSNNSEAMLLRAPVPLQISEIDKKGFSYSVQSMYRLGGIDVLDNSSARILTGL